MKQKEMMEALLAGETIILSRHEIFIDSEGDIVDQYGDPCPLPTSKNYSIKPRTHKLGGIEYPEPMNIDTADHVLHKPSGDQWLVAYATETEVIPCGWPLSYAKKEDCDLIKKATPEQKLQLLNEIAASDGNDPRTRYAISILAAI